MKLSRRKFIGGSASVLATASGLQMGFAQAALPPGARGKTLVYLFLRGGIDGLNLVIPRTGTHRAEYEMKRPNIQVPVSGPGAMLNLNGQFGLHGSATGLKALYDSGKLAIVHAVGMPEGTGSRSHFDSQEMYELGTPGDLSTATGWLARHMISTPGLVTDAAIPSLSTGSSSPTSLLGDNTAMTLDDARYFHPNAGRYGNEHLDALAQIYAGTSSLDYAVQNSIDTINMLEQIDLELPAFYPDTSLADDLGLVAGMLKMNVGLQVATVDFGGWDTHNGQGNDGGGYFAGRVEILSQAIEAFMNDLASHGLENDVVLVVQSEFGRRVRENGNQGTDHGTAHPMLVIGGRVQGGVVYGTFPGIADDDLYLNTDVRATTDFREVLGDIVVNFMKNPNLDFVFPGYTGPISLGLTGGAELFGDGFE
ncbi:DUF1501 domain-containing protein [Thiolapillus sp.]